MRSGEKQGTERQVSRHSSGSSRFYLPDLAETVKLCGLLRDRGVRNIDISASQSPRRLFRPQPDEISAPFAGSRRLRPAGPGVSGFCPGSPGRAATGSGQMLPPVQQVFPADESGPVRSRLCCEGSGSLCGILPGKHTEQKSMTGGRQQ